MRLDIENVSAGYGRFKVLDGVSLTVPQGGLVALLGPNGAGKTTLLKAVSGLLPTSSGRVLVDGRDLGDSGATARARAGVCLIPEGRAIFRSLSVAENLAMHAQSLSASEAVEAACSFFPVLGQRLKQNAGTLSGGEQQMLAFSRAIIREAPIVLADELSLGLAPTVVEDIFEAVVRLKDADRSFLVVEQYAELMLDLADYIYVLTKGRVFTEGRPAEVRSQISEGYIGSGSVTETLPDLAEATGPSDAPSPR